MYSAEFSWLIKVKNLPATAGDMGPIPGLERSPEKEITCISSIVAQEITVTCYNHRSQESEHLA